MSILVNAAGDQARVEYGMAIDDAQSTLVDAQQSEPQTSGDGSPIVIELSELSPDTKYYYRLQYLGSGKDAQLGPIHSFHTQRAKGSAFHFGVQGDTHPERYNNKMFHADLFALTLEQVRSRQPDLYVMLGDDFSIEAIIQNFKTANYGASYLFQQATEGSLRYSEYQTLAYPFSEPMIEDGLGAPRHSAAYLELRRDYLGAITSDTALFTVNGNHEQASLANIGGVFNNAAIWAAEARLKYYPLPSSNAFYSGDSARMAPVNGYPTIIAADGLLRDYYAFTWGDALFVTIDPYWHSPNMPESSLYNGDGGKKGSIWNATLGDEQYAWLKRTLEGSTAKWKFVFTHHINGTGRGGAASITSGEWGGSVSEFRTNRPTWEKTIHQLLVDTKVTILFQAHDHMYAREIVDGVVYQEVPNPADNSYFAYNCDAYAPLSIAWQGQIGYGNYDPTATVRLPNTGYLDVTVTPEFVRVDYIRTYRAIDLQTNPNNAFTGREVNGEVAFSYSLPPQATDSQPSDVQFICSGAAPPSTWVYNP